jgi:methylmalonyl-CoA/ethylmalonyl-CoA epimerase
MHSMTFDHVAIAVADLDAAVKLWCEAFGLRCEHVEDVPAQRVRVAFLRGQGPGARVELIQAADPEAGVARFLGERGAALHHVAFAVADLAGALAATALQKIDAAPRPGAEGRQVAFLHPRATGGVLVEWVGGAGA